MEDQYELKHRYRNYFGVYNRYSVPGFGILLFGISIFGLGIFDIAWTVSRYSLSCTQNYDYPSLNTCGGNHIYTLVGSSLWGGMLLVINGVFSLWMPHRYVTHNCLFQFFTILTFLNAVAVSPAITVLNALELAWNTNVYFQYTNSMFTVADRAKFGVVFAITILGGIEFILTAGLLLVSCLCPAPKKRRQYYPRPLADWHPRLPHLPHPHFGKLHPNLNPSGRPMFNAASWLPSFYGQGTMQPYGPYGQGFASPYGQGYSSPYAQQGYYNPYRYYSAMAGGGYYPFPKPPTRPQIIIDDD